MSPRNGIRLGKSRGSVQEISQVMESGIKWWRQLIVLVHFRHLTVTEGWLGDMLYCRGNWRERSGNSTLDIHQVTHWLVTSWMCITCLILLSRCPKSQHLMVRFLHVQHNAIVWYMLKPSVCLSVISRCSTEMAEKIKLVFERERLSWTYATLCSKGASVSSTIRASLLGQSSRGK